MSILCFIYMLIDFHIAHVNYIAGSIAYQLRGIVNTGIVLIYHFNMIYITVNKLIEILLHIRYPVYWNERKAKYLLIVTWVIGIFLSTIVTIAYKLRNFHYDQVFSLYFYPTIDFIFLTLTFTIYGLIFHKFKQTRQCPSQHGSRNSTNQNRSVFQVFRKSKFYIPVLWITSFVIFTIVPDLIYLFTSINQDVSLPVSLHACCYTSYAISTLVDGCVYVYLQKQVRRLLRRKCNEFFCCINTEAITNGNKRKHVISNPPIHTQPQVPQVTCNSVVYKDTRENIYLA